MLVNFRKQNFPMMFFGRVDSGMSEKPIEWVLRLWRICCQPCKIKEQDSRPCQLNIGLHRKPRFQSEQGSPMLNSQESSSLRAVLTRGRIKHMDQYSTVKKAIEYFGRDPFQAAA